MEEEHVTWLEADRYLLVAAQPSLLDALGIGARLPARQRVGQPAEGVRTL